MRKKPLREHTCTKSICLGENHSHPLSQLPRLPDLVFLVKKSTIKLRTRSFSSSHDQSFSESQRATPDPHTDRHQW